RAGSVLVAGDVPGAQILIDGQARGTTPMVVDGLPEGPHQVEIRADGLPPHSEQVFIRAGQRATVSPDLRATGRG
ncbi:MAG TPA: S-layer protein, partial [Myxococcales bacterium]|nr:S-layer protein [Myxococcales bacterium]